MDIFGSVKRFAGDKLEEWFGGNQAPAYDKSVGASTDPVFDADGNVTPAAQKIIKQSNTGASLINKEDRNVLATTAEKVDPVYQDRSYANPYRNATYIGKSGNTLGTLVHELGHLDTSERQGIRERLQQGVGVAGRALTTLGELPSPLSAPLKAAGGLVRQHVDANEEDVAERYRDKHSQTLFTDSDHPNVGAKAYGNNERLAGQRTLADGLDPTGIIRGTATFADQHIMGPAKEQARQRQIAELNTQFQADQERFQQLPEDYSQYTSDQRSFLKEASSRSSQLDDLRQQSARYNNK